LQFKVGVTHKSQPDFLSILLHLNPAVSKNHFETLSDPHGISKTPEIPILDLPISTMHESGIFELG